jgi:hypothetical protein
MNRAISFQRRGPDTLTLELAKVLSADTWFEFRPLFLVVHENLRARKAAHGGEEILRLRAYDKLQTMVQLGKVEKVGKTYRGIPSPVIEEGQEVAAAVVKTAVALQ